MIGDSSSDMEFGNRLRMITVKIGKEDRNGGEVLKMKSLADFSKLIMR